MKTKIEIANQDAAERLLALQRFLYKISVPDEEERTGWSEAIDHAYDVLMNTPG